MNWYATLQKNSFLWLLLILVQVGLSSVSILVPLWLAQALSDHAAQQLIFLLFLSSGLIIFDYITRLCYTSLETNLALTIRNNCYTELINSPADFLKKNGLGNYISKIERITYAYKEAINSLFFGLMPTIIRIGTVIAAFFYYTALLAYILGCFLIVILLLKVFAYSYFLPQAEQERIDAEDKIKREAIMYGNALPLIEYTGGQQHAITQLAKSITTTAKKELRYWLKANSIYGIVAGCANLSLCFSFYTLFYAVESGAITAPLAIALIGSYMRSLTSIIRLERPLAATIKAIAGIRDFFMFTRQKISFKKSLLPEKNLFQADLSLKAHRLKNNKIEELFFRVPVNQQNKLYCIEGPSGSGKTTLAANLAGFSDKKEGSWSTSINGIDPSELTQEERAQLVLYQPHPMNLITSTLEENLFLGVTQTPDNLSACLEYLSRYVPTKKLSSSAHSLSQGEKQKVLFINTLLRIDAYNPLLIILDEPTAHIDFASALLLEETILKLAHERIVIIVSHDGLFKEKSVDSWLLEPLESILITT